MSGPSWSFFLAMKRPTLDTMKEFTMWNKDQVCEVYGGQNEDAPIAGPPPLADRKRHHWLFPAAILSLCNLPLVVTTIVIASRMTPGQSHDIPAAAPVIQVHVVEPKAEPVKLVQVPTPKSQAESVPVIPAPAIEPEPAPRRRDRILAVEPEPVRVAQAPTVEREREPVMQSPEPVRQLPANNEVAYWHDDQVYESIIRFNGKIGLIRQPLIEFRQTLPSHITMWSEPGPNRSVDIHLETNYQQRIDLANYTQMTVTAAWLATAGMGCPIGREHVRDIVPKQSESMHSTSTAHSPGTFLTNR